MTDSFILCCRFFSVVNQYLSGIVCFFPGTTDGGFECTLPVPALHSAVAAGVFPFFIVFSFATQLVYFDSDPLSPKWDVRAHGRVAFAYSAGSVAISVAKVFMWGGETPFLLLVLLVSLAMLALSSTLLPFLNPRMNELKSALFAMNAWASFSSLLMLQLFGHAGRTEGTSASLALSAACLAATPLVALAGARSARRFFALVGAGVPRALAELERREALWGHARDWSLHGLDTRSWQPTLRALPGPPAPPAGASAERKASSTGSRSVAPLALWSDAHTASPQLLTAEPDREPEAKGKAGRRGGGPRAAPGLAPGAAADALGLAGRRAVTMKDLRERAAAEGRRSLYGAVAGRLRLLLPPPALGFLAEAQLDTAARFLLETRRASEGGVEEAERVYRAGLALYPASAFLHVQLAGLRFCAAQDAASAMREVLASQKRRSWEQQQLASANLGEKSMNFVRLLEFRRLFQAATKAHNEALHALKALWSQIADSRQLAGEGALATLYRRIATINRSKHEAAAAYAQLTSKFPSSKVIMRTYGIFLQDIQNDPEAAAAQFAAADEIEENEARADAGPQADGGRSQSGGSSHWRKARRAAVQAENTQGQASRAIKVGLGVGFSATALVLALELALLAALLDAGRDLTARLLAAPRAPPAPPRPRRPPAASPALAAGS
eukprot:tig00000514_g1797.t1